MLLAVHLRPRQKQEKVTVCAHQYDIYTKVCSICCKYLTQKYYAKTKFNLTFAIRYYSQAINLLLAIRIVYANTLLNKLYY